MKEPRNTLKNLVAYFFLRTVHAITITFGMQYLLNGATAYIKLWSLQ
jgi:hypothetical protein